MHDECIYDYLEFRDGDQNSSDLIGKFCGFNMPPNIKSSGNKLRVKFASDASVEKAGFSLKFIKGTFIVHFCFTNAPKMKTYSFFRI